jgi:hypothetical protein
MKLLSTRHLLVETPLNVTSLNSWRHIQRDYAHTFRKLEVLCSLLVIFNVLHTVISEMEDLTNWAKVKVKLSLCLTKHHAMKTYWESGGIAPRVLDFGTRWRRVVNFTPRPLYPHGKSPRYPLDRRMGGPQSGLYA